MIFKLFGIPHTTRSRKRTYVLYPDTIIKSRPPNTIHKKIHPHFLRYSKYHIPNSFVLLLNKGISTNKGINLTKNGAMIPIVLDRSYHDRSKRKHVPRKLWVKSHHNFFPQINYDFSVATLIMNYSHSYFHWLFDVLPKIHLIEKMGLTADKIYVKAKTKTQKESLKLLNYGEEKIINASKFDLISAQKLIIPYLPRTDIKHLGIYKFLR